MTVRVPAKVNLQLAVGPLREDGYHELATVFHAVDLHDEVIVRHAPEGAGVTLTISGEGADSLPTDGSNLAAKAVRMLAAHAGFDPAVTVHLAKGIPVAGGMAGGSADAAGALVACDVLWQLGLSRDELSDFAAQLGSDVPFSLHGGTCIGTGRGEQLMPVLGRGHFHWVFALADGGLSTPAVYAECDRLREGLDVPDPRISEELMQGLRSGDAHQLGRALSNDLQAAAISLRPSLARVLAVGEDFGALGGIVSGSGPTCAFLVRDAEDALDLAVALSGEDVCRTVKVAEGPAHGARVVG